MHFDAAPLTRVEMNSAVPPGDAVIDEAEPCSLHDEVAALRARIAEFEAEKERHAAMVQQQCDLAIVEAKKAHQRALLSLEADIETTLRAQISAELREVQSRPHSQRENKRLSAELEKKSAALKRAEADFRLESSKLRAEAEQSASDLKLARDEIVQLRSDSETQSQCSQQKIDALQILLESEKLQSLCSRAELESRVTRLSAQIESQSRQDEAQHAAALADLHEKLQLSNEEVKRTRLQLNESNAQLQSNNALCDELANDTTRLKSQLNDAQRLLYSIRHDSELEIRQKAQELANIKLEYEQSLRQLNASALTDKEEIVRVQNENSMLNTKIGDAQQTIERLEIDKSGAVENAASLQAQLQDLKSSLIQANQQRMSLQHEVRLLVNDTPPQTAMVRRVKSLSAIFDYTPARRPLCFEPDLGTRDCDVRIDYLRQTFKQYLLKTDMRRQLAPAIAKILLLKKDEERKLLKHP